MSGPAWMWGLLLWAAAAPGQSSVTLVAEFDENKLRMQENWQIEVPESVDGSTLRFRLPEGAILPGVDQGAEQFVLAENDRVVTHPETLAAGTHLLVFHYQFPTSGRSTAITWSPPPISVMGARVAYPALEGLETSLGPPNSTRNVDEVVFQIHDVPTPFQNGEFNLRLEGLPVVVTSHRTAALVLCVLVVAGTVALLLKPSAPDRAAADPLHVQKDRLVQAIADLEKQPLSDPDAHQRRHRELMDRLAQVLRRQAHEG